MLVLTRSRNQCIRVGENVSIHVLDVRGNQVRIGVQAPRAVAVDREEIRHIKLRRAQHNKKPPDRTGPPNP